MTFSGTVRLREGLLTALVDTSPPPVTCPARGRGRAPPPAPRCPAGPRRWADTPGGPAQRARGHKVTRSQGTDCGHLVVNRLHHSVHATVADKKASVGQGCNRIRSSEMESG